MRLVFSKGIGTVIMVCLELAGVPVACCGSAWAQDAAPVPGLLLPKTDSRRGKDLYLNKGCVGCHAINGVGGAHAAPLDAATMEPTGNPFEFFARMWLGMQPMIAMQEDKMGTQIDLTAQELGDIVAFIHDGELQKSLKTAEVPENIEDIME